MWKLLHLIAVLVDSLATGKYSVFEGGIRVAAFVSGGLVPAQLRGTSNDETVHIADW